MEAVLSRLKQDRERLRDRWFAEGAACARDWVEHEASHVELRRLGEASAGERLHLLREATPPGLQKHLTDLGKKEDFERESFLEGFAQAVHLMWDVIKRNL